MQTIKHLHYTLGSFLPRAAALAARGVVVACLYASFCHCAACFGTAPWIASDIGLSHCGRGRTWRAPAYTLGLSERRIAITHGHDRFGAFGAACAACLVASTRHDVAYCGTAQWIASDFGLSRRGRDRTLCAPVFYLGLCERRIAISHGHDRCCAFAAALVHLRFYAWPAGRRDPPRQVDASACSMHPGCSPSSLDLPTGSFCTQSLTT